MIDKIIELNNKIESLVNIINNLKCCGNCMYCPGESKTVKDGSIFEMFYGKFSKNKEITVVELWCSSKKHPKYFYDYCDDWKFDPEIIEFKERKIL